MYAYVGMCMCMCMYLDMYVCMYILIFNLIKVFLCREEARFVEEFFN